MAAKTKQEYDVLENQRAALHFYVAKQYGMEHVWGDRPHSRPAVLHASVRVKAGRGEDASTGWIAECYLIDEERGTQTLSGKLPVRRISERFWEIHAP